MTTGYAVVWTKTARQDLLQIIAYLKGHSPSAAASVFASIKEKALELDRLAERGRVVPELQRQGVFCYRELIIANWRLVYKVVGSMVTVVAVFDARRNLEDVLLLRLLGLDA